MAIILVVVTRVCTFLFAMCVPFAFVHAQEGTTLPQPTLESAPQPIYPKIAKDAGIGGTVVVSVVVDDQGAIVSVNHASGPAKLCSGGENDPRLVALREAVIEAIKGSKFLPAMENGRPVRSVAYLSANFEPIDPSRPGAKLTEVRRITEHALSMPKPVYPGAARAVRAAGPVGVNVVVDEHGSVFTAEARSGHPLLRRSAENAACLAKFSPMAVDNKPARMTGLITYNFVPAR